MRVGLVTLGCDKNTVDNEYLAGLLAQQGHTVEPGDASSPPDVVVITTCGFLETARQQSIDTIKDWARIREKSGTRLGVIGCLAQRAAAELIEEIPGIDFMAGVGDFDRVAALVEKAGPSKFITNSGQWELGVQSAAVTDDVPFDNREFAADAPRLVVPRSLPRQRMDRRPHGFLKISDGCNHTCTFCSIPLMKGVYTSVPRQILLDEARRLLDDGVREINIVAQDITKYGLDLEKRMLLPDLLADLAALPGHFWLRLFYLYPSTVTRDLVQLMKEQPKIVRYLDIPLQHLDTAVLQRMKRPHDAERTMDMLRHIRAELPGVTLRTTFIVGFPGESGPEFKNLLEAMQEIRFERLGAFTYSREEGTPAAKLPNQIGEKVKERRREKVLKLQAAISAEWAAAQVGTTREVLIEGRAPDGNFVGRSHSEAADIDGIVSVKCHTPPAVGDFIQARVVAADTYDLVAEQT